MVTKIPEYQDEVKNVKNDTAGTVIAKYTIEGKTYLDIRSTEEKVYYATPIENWTVVKQYCD
jgi:hypothetical protein